MKQEQADRLSEIAERMELVNWSIGEYTPEGRLNKKILAFHFEGVGDFPRFRRRIDPHLLDGTRVVLDTEKNRVTIY